MKIVIDIPEEDYKFVKKQVADGITNPLKICIANGTPLPKGHGRLLILSEDAAKRERVPAYCSCQLWISDIGLSNATVAVIEADKYKAESEIHCNCTDEEIVKSFTEDVEVVKDLLPREESEG